MDSINKSWGFAWRAHPLFAVFTIGIAMFTDAFLYSIIVPIIPFILEDNVGIPKEQHQFYVSQLLSTFAITSFVLSPIAGGLTDKSKIRRMPFLIGLAALIVATVLMFTARTIALLTIARVLQGASAAVIWTVGLALCRDTVGTENLGKTIGTIFSFVSVGTVFAPVAGGSLYRKAGIRSVAALCLSLLAVDFIMRVLIIEKNSLPTAKDSNVDAVDTIGSNNHETEESAEDTPLLAQRNISDDYFIPKDQSAIIREIPILYCFKAPSLLVAMFMMLFQGIIVSSFDATVPLHARQLFSFNSMSSGLLFAPLGIAQLVSGPIAGWAVDRYGPKYVATIGYLWLVPVLVLFRLIKAEPHNQQIALYASLLGLGGIGIGIVTGPPIFEAGETIERFHKRNPDFFGPNGPYAQLYGISNMVFCAGLTLGPIIAGGLRTRIGYGDMNAVLAIGSFATAVMCAIWITKKSSAKQS